MAKCKYQSFKFHIQNLGFPAYRMNYIILAVLILPAQFLFGQWNPHAGYIPPISEHARIITSSPGSNPEHALDGNLATPWKSGNPLPANYLNSASANILLEKNNWLSSPDANNLPQATDGNLNNSAWIAPVNGMAELIVTFPKAQQLIYFSLKAAGDVPIVISGVDVHGRKFNVANYNPKQWINGVPLPNKKLTQIIITSSKAFAVNELGALIAAPKEFLILDLCDEYPISTIFTKHWAGNNTATETKLYISKDNINWQEMARLDPNSTEFTPTFLPHGTTGRYVKIEHSINLAGNDGVFVFEIKVLDTHGAFGPPPAPTKSKHKLKDIVGVNAVWGWGFKDNKPVPKQGANLHHQYATHARNYHFRNWEVTDPDNPIDFKKMADGEGTPALGWLNWDTEYRNWNDAGLKVQASILFGLYLNFGLWWEDQWDTPYQSAYDYGYAFAKHFGPTHGNGLVEVMEVGNEPWYYEAATYRKILAGMSEGAKAADPAMQVFPCALQAAHPDAEIITGTLTFKNYMGARITEATAKYLDGINIHHYSFIKNDKGEQIAVHPEHPGSEFNGIRNAIRFRDQNMPGKKIFLSEFGWDSDSANEDCTHSECVTAAAAAAYLVRATLIAHRCNLDRATVFFYANEDKASGLFTRSGLTESRRHNFKPKQNMVALQSLVDQLGDVYFLDVFREDEAGYIYQFGKADGTVTHLVAWLPVDGNDTKQKTVAYPADSAPACALRIDGATPGGTVLELPEFKDGRMMLKFGAKPVVVEF